MLTFIMGPEKRRVFFSNDFLSYLNCQRQLIGTCEAGGGIFAKEYKKIYQVEKATGPYPVDMRRTNCFRPSLVMLNKDIHSFKSEGLYFVGIWHTHSEPIPKPSGMDIQAMRKMYVENQHSLSAMMLIIVGQAPFPQGLWVSLHDHQGYEQIKFAF